MSWGAGRKGRKEEAGGISCSDSYTKATIAPLVAASLFSRRCGKVLSIARLLLIVSLVPENLSLTTLFHHSLTGS